MSETDVCANCHRPYSEHRQDTRCPLKYRVDGAKWFPQKLADALTKQQRRIRSAQRKLTSTQRGGTPDRMR